MSGNLKLNEHEMRLTEAAGADGGADQGARQHVPSPEGADRAAGQGGLDSRCIWSHSHSGVIAWLPGQSRIPI